MARIILASASPRRKDILEQVGISCEVIPSSIDEDLITADSPSALVEALSKAKAEDVAAHFENDFVVIGADTVVVKDSKVLGKPSNEAEAHKMLQMLQGNRHEVFTGVTLISVSGGKGLIDTFHVRTIVDMIPMTPELITSYIQTGEPMDKAGGYGIQGLAGLFIREITGSYSGIMGLPVFETGALLRPLGLTAF